MKILYLGAFRLPNCDAAAPRVLNNAKAFRNVGHSVSFISWGGKYRESDLCEDSKYRVYGFEYVITNELSSNGSLLQRLMSKYHRGDKTMSILQSLEQKPDLIIMYNAGYKQTHMMLRFCAQRKIKLANDITEWFANKELHLLDLLPNYLNLVQMQRKVKNKIVISSYLDKYYPESNNLLLPPMCDPGEKKWSDTVEDERVKPFDGVTLIYAGTPARKDCLHSAIRAVNQLIIDGAKMRFIILGTSREAYIGQYSHLLKTNVIHENILFLGRVSQDLIPAYYKIADFMILLREPNRKSTAGFPTKFAESMTAGVPVIANLTSDLGQYLHDGKTGFIVNGYEYNDIIQVLRNKVITIDKNKIRQMKKETMKISESFHFNTYSDNVSSFMNKLR